MQARLTDKPIQEIVAAILELDLEPVKLRVMDPELGHGWTRERADGVGEAYRKYLTMVAKHQDQAEDIVLSKDVDEFWHTHILQTMKYTHDCQQIFGGYLHHDPHVGQRTRADIERKNELARKTQALYRLEFGGDHKDEAAWAGIPLPDVKQAAWSNASIRAGNAAWSNAAIQGKNAAWSNAAIEGKNAAWSNAAIQGKNAAWSNAAIQGKNAAWSNAAIEGKNSAWSNAAIQTK